jgi:hypothetical protein
MSITNPQKTIIATICHKLGFNKEAKAEMIMGFTQGRETSSTGLTFAEANSLIKALNLANALNELNGESESQRKMTGKIFYYAHEMGWVKTNTAGQRVADGERVNEWMIKSSYLKKKLSAYTLAELPKLVSQFAQVYKYYLVNNDRVKITS